MQGYLHFLRNLGPKIRYEVQEYDKKCDGKLAMHTNDTEMEAGHPYRIYKDLQEIERSWRILKSAIKMRPTFH